MREGTMRCDVGVGVGAETAGILPRGREEESCLFGGARMCVFVFGCGCGCVC